MQANPDAALRDRAEPLLIDEWQAAPAVLGAVKRAVDVDPRPGRFLLTGSVTPVSSTTRLCTKRLTSIARQPRRTSACFTTCSSPKRFRRGSRTG